MRKLTIIKFTILACSAGLFLTACQCFESKNKKEAYSPSSSTGQASTSTASGDETVIPIYEEQVKVGKRTVDAGQVTIRKTVTTETVNQPIELRRETVVIEREDGKTETISSSEPAGTASSSGAGLEEKTYTIQLQKEEAVVEKNIVQTGQIVARKNSQIEQQTVQREVRKENVAVDKNGENIEIRDISTSQISEPSGAQTPAPYIYESTDSKNVTPGIRKGVDDLKQNPPRY